MAEKVLTPSEVLEIVYKSDESLSDSSSESVGSTDNEFDDIAGFQVGEYGQLHRTQRSVQL